MATEHTKQRESEKRIKAQEDEISYLKTKIYELIATNKDLRKELLTANCKIKNLQNSHKNPRNKQEEGKKYENETWQKMETRRDRRHKRNNIHVRGTHRDRAREDNGRHDERIHRPGENMLSKSRNHKSRPRQTPMISKPQRTSYHIKKNTNKNETNRIERSQTRRHKNAERDTIIRSRHQEPRSPKRPLTKRGNRYDRSPDTRFRRDGQPRRSDIH